MAPWSRSRKKNIRLPKPCVKNIFCRINNHLKVSPGMSPLFLSQKIAAKLPEKNIPSTAAKAMMRSAKEALLALIHLSAQSAFRLMAGMVSMALKSLSFSAASLKNMNNINKMYWRCRLRLITYIPTNVLRYKTNLVSFLQYKSQTKGCVSELKKASYFIENIIK